MSKTKKKVARFTGQEFMVPEKDQSYLRELDVAGVKIQQDVGSLEISYLQQKTALLAKFHKNRELNDASIRGIALERGVDLSSPDEKWKFDFPVMKFTRMP